MDLGGKAIQKANIGRNLAWSPDNHRLAAFMSGLFGEISRIKRQ
jgi:hypothetical protein